MSSSHTVTTFIYSHALLISLSLLLEIKEIFCWRVHIKEALYTCYSELSSKPLYCYNEKKERSYFTYFNVLLADRHIFASWLTRTEDFHQVNFREYIFVTYRVILREYLKYHMIMTLMMKLYLSVKIS